MDILVVGSGICGLTAAIRLRRQGHRIFEQSKLAEESGAAIFLPPNANGLLRAWGFRAEEYGGTVYRGHTHFTHDGKVVLAESVGEDDYANRWDMIRRSSLHTGLKELAIDPIGSGIPAEILTASRVVSIDIHKPSARTEGGREICGHVLLGADSWHSRCREAITGTGEDDYQSAGSKTKLASAFADFEPAVQKIIELVNADEVKLYPLNDMQFLSTFVKGKLALIGDAAHPFLPCLLAILKYHHFQDAHNNDLCIDQGQRGAQAIEDAVSVAAMLPADLDLGKIPQRLKLYEKARKARVEQIQTNTRLAGGQIRSDTPLDCRF